MHLFIHKENLTTQWYDFKEHKIQKKNVLLGKRMSLGILYPLCSVTSF